MSSRHRIPVLISVAAAAALLLGGCASSGTVGAKGGTGGPTGGTTTSTLAQPTDTSSSSADAPTTTDSSPSTDGSSSDSSGDSAMQQQLKSLAGMMTDPGCKEAVNALGDIIALENDPLKAAGAFPQALQKIRQGAATTKKPAAKTAINKLADDLQNIFNTAAKGGTPDMTAITTDSQAFGMACVS